MRQAEPINPGPVHLMKRATELRLGDRGGSDHRQHHGLPHKVHISSHGPEPFPPSPACLSRIVGSHTPYASSRLWMNIVPFRYLGMLDPFFPLRLIIALHLANDHTLSPTKLLLQPYSRVCLRKKLRGQPKAQIPQAASFSTNTYRTAQNKITTCILRHPSQGGCGGTLQCSRAACRGHSTQTPHRS